MRLPWFGRHRAATPLTTLLTKARLGVAAHRAAEDDVPSPARRTLLTATPAVGIALALSGLAAGDSPHGADAVVKTIPEPGPDAGITFGLNEAPSHRRLATLARKVPRLERKRKLHKATTKPATRPKPAPRRTTPPQPVPTHRGIRDRIISQARALLGIPYSYGGESLSGMDCSGFTQYVYARVGLRIPRTAASQYYAMRHIAQPQLGDLVFFPLGGVIGHVGIYAGSGEMYAAPHTGDVIKRETIYTSNVLYATAL